MADPSQIQQTTPGRHTPPGHHVIPAQTVTQDGKDWQGNCTLHLWYWDWK